MKRAKAYRGLATLLAGLALAGGAAAADLALAGILGRKALLVVDRGAPQVVAVGKQTAEGVKLLAIEGERAIVEFEGQRHALRLGARVVRQGGDGRGAQGGGGRMTSEEARKVLARGVEMTLDADEKGYFMTEGEINGGRVRFLVDTGATTVAMGYSEARRLGIRLADEPTDQSLTAGGMTRMWKVTLGSVKVGSMRFDNVTAAVMESEMPFVLLGMNVLEHMEMQRNGKRMRLKKKF
ncbi:MAG: retroviral-like aspartic protease family protein [Azoarcus sp.]|nr:retroviral-like aspartic protease family protein [Azoarcus sp.]